MGTGWPAEIDTRQVFQNGPSPAPDSDTRVDSELVNDTLSTLVTLETVLGSNPQGTFASLAARLNFYLPESAGITNVIPFTQQTLVFVPGATHAFGTAALLWEVYDAATPRARLEPGSVTVHPANYDVTVEFGLPQNGTLLLDAPDELYSVTFTNTNAITILGSAHSLGTADLFWRVYDNSIPRAALQVGSVTIHPTTFDVTITLPVAQSGLVALSPGRHAYATNFTSTLTVTVPGGTHGLDTAALFAQAYTLDTPRAALQAGSVTVHPTTFEVSVTFTTAQSGRLLLAAAVEPGPGLLAARQSVHGAPAPLTPATVLELTHAVHRLTARLLALESAHAQLESTQAALVTQLQASPPSPEETTPC